MLHVSAMGMSSGTGKAGVPGGLLHHREGGAGVEGGRYEGAAKVVRRARAPKQASDEAGG